MTADREAPGPARDASLQRALGRLYERVPLGMRLGLGPMAQACARFGHPERAFEAVHVAGTNGKGSACAMVEGALRAGGRRVGLYTSPHLCRVGERIRVDGVPIDDAALAELLERVLDGAPDLSFFETLTLAAFVAFREAKVDVGVVEVGLGGRLDATNVLERPRATAITRIALDHVDRLGPTLVDIAREKAGIAKTGVPMFLGPMTGEVRAAIDEVAAARGATTVDAADPATMAVASRAELALAGAHQIVNAAIAVRLAKALGIAEAAIARGLHDTRWPGRLERIERPEGPYLLDAAHNPDGIEALARHLADHPAEGRTLVFGALGDKAWTSMIDRLAPLFPAGRVYVAPQGRAPAAPDAIAARHPGRTAASVKEACAAARALAGTREVVVAGSIFLVGEARAGLLSLPFDRFVAL
jgi:dihydrofolate synthase/folylpolyglutamate synthase